jgi:hypothetical protein
VWEPSRVASRILAFSECLSLAISGRQRVLPITTGFGVTTDEICSKADVILDVRLTPNYDCFTPKSRRTWRVLLTAGNSQFQPFKKC